MGFFVYIEVVKTSIDDITGNMEGTEIMKDDKTVKTVKAVKKGSQGGVKVWQERLASLRGAVMVAEAIKKGEYAYSPNKAEAGLLVKSIKAQKAHAEKELVKTGWKIPSRLAKRINALTA